MKPFLSILLSILFIINCGPDDSADSSGVKAGEALGTKSSAPPARPVTSPTRPVTPPARPVTPPARPITPPAPSPIIPSFESQTQWAKSIAERFIYYLSNNVDKTLKVAQEYLVLPPAAKSDIKRDGLLDFDKIRNNSLPAHFDFLAHGHYSRVFVHKGYPNYVTKIVLKQSGLLEAQVNTTAIKAIISENLYFLHAPSSTVIDLPGKFYDSAGSASLFLQEKVPFTMGWNATVEAWTRIVAHYESTSNLKFKRNLEELVVQICVFLAKVGYWDVSPTNFPLLADDAKKVFAIDFDNIKKGHDLNQKRIGFDRLVELFFPLDPLADIILKRLNVSTLGVAVVTPADKKFSDSKQKGQTSFETIKEALAIYDQRGWFRPNQTLVALDEGTITDIKEKELMKAIYSALLEHNAKILSKDKDKDKAVTEIRRLDPIPNSSVRDAFRDLDPAFNLKEEKYLKIIEKILDELKRQGIIVAWNRTKFSTDWQYDCYI